MGEQARERLISERRRIQEEVDDLRDGDNLGPEREATADLSGNDQHPAEEGTETFDRERDLSILDSLEAELDEIEAALGRVDDGSYGKCELCGRPIGGERLEALPSARLCIDHENLQTPSCGLPSRPTASTEADRPASCLEISRPIPDDAPVTTTRRRASFTWAYIPSAVDRETPTPTQLARGESSRTSSH